MITTQKMASCAERLFRRGETLVDADGIRREIYNQEMRKLGVANNEIPLILKQALREKLSREIDERFPGKVISTLLGNEDPEENGAYLVVGVNQFAVDNRDVLFTGSFPLPGKDVEVDGSLRRVTPLDCLPSRKEGPAVAVLFFHEVGCPYLSVWQAYISRRKGREVGTAETAAKIEAKAGPFVERIGS
jgi:hypothetical protein